MAKKNGSEERADAVEAIIKEYGEGSIMKAGDATHLDVEAISTGALAIDVALGIGGIPRGRITEIYGPYSSGKSTFCMHVIAEAQKKGLKTLYVDAEHAMDPSYARNIGVDIDELYISQPVSGEEGLNIAAMATESGEFGLVVIDSVAALTPRSELKGEIGDANVGAQARMMGQGCRKLEVYAGKTNTAVVFVNQIRYKIGVMFGSPETTPGGEALKFAASVRIDIRRRDGQKEDGELIGNIHHVKVIKNKVAPPFKECDVKIIYGEGFDKDHSLIEVATDLGVIEKNGGWYKYDGANIGQGVSGVSAMLDDNPEVRELITKQVYEIITA